MLDMGKGKYQIMPFSSGQNDWGAEEITTVCERSPSSSTYF